MTMQPRGEVDPTDTVTPEAEFGMRLRKAREQQGISLREMARRLTRAHSNLWDYERGHRLATVEIAAEYERHLSLPEGQLRMPLEQARRAVYGAGRDRRRPFRPPPPLLPPAVLPQQPPRSDRAELRPRGPFVGRDDELGPIRFWLDEVRAGEPRVIVLRGDAGIGKSTLLAHVLADARSAGWRTLCGSCRQGARIPYLPLASALAAFGAGRRSSSGSPSMLLDTLLGEGGHPTEVLSESAADRRHLSLYVAITRAVLEAADQQPLILAIEDLHWADESTLGVLEHLAAVATQQSALTPLPIALILTTRRPPEGDLPWRVAQRMKREITYRELDLSALDDLDINRVITEVSKARPSPRLLRSVSSASQGNPLLLRSLLDGLLADGALTVHGGLLSSIDPPLPTTALDLDAELGARLDRVGGACDDLLRWAAILGDGQSLSALPAVAGYGDAEFDQMIGAAVEARVLHEDGDSYRYDDPEMREMLSAKVPRRQLARRHLEVAERLEACPGTDPPGRAIA
jgi:predicted ATPase